jgi:hypothetical protein
VREFVGRLDFGWPCRRLRKWPDDGSAIREMQHLPELVGSLRI